MRATVAAAIGSVSQGRAQAPVAVTDYVGANEPPGLPTTMRYGKASEETLAVYTQGRKRGPVPVVIWLPGAGWPHSGPVLDVHQMHGMLANADLASAIIGTRDARYHGVREATSEIIKAIGMIVARSADLNVDPHRLIFVGVGSAAFYLALLATDPAALAAAGVAASDVKAMVLIAPDGLLGAEQIIADSRLSTGEAQRYFGGGAEREELAPLRRMQSLTVRSFLIFNHPRSHPEELQQFADAVRAAGAAIDIQPIVATKTGISATYLGSPTSVAGRQFLTFVESSSAYSPRTHAR